MRALQKDSQHINRNNILAMAGNGSTPIGTPFALRFSPSLHSTNFPLAFSQLAPELPYSYFPSSLFWLSEQPRIRISKETEFREHILCMHGQQLFEERELRLSSAAKNTDAQNLRSVEVNISLFLFVVAVSSTYLA